MNLIVPRVSIAQRFYWHDISSDLVPAGMRASRFRSQRSTVDASLKSPLFGSNAPRLATLAVSCSHKEFAATKATGLRDSLLEIALPPTGFDIALGTLLHAKMCPWYRRGLNQRERHDIDRTCNGIEVSLVLTAAAAAEGGETEGEKISDVDIVFDEMQERIIHGVYDGKLARHAILDAVASGTILPPADDDSVDEDDIEDEKKAAL